MKKSQFHFHFLLATIVVMGITCTKDKLIPIGSKAILSDITVNIDGEDFYFKGYDETHYVAFFDILFTKEDVENLKYNITQANKGKFLRGATTNAKWPCNIVYYRFDSSFDNALKQKILSTFQIIEGKTKVRFKSPVHNAPRSWYVLINDRSGTGGEATVGKSTKSKLNIGTGASTREILHEIAHTVGLGHEHQRSDGERFLDYFRANTKKEYWTDIKPLSYLTGRGSLDWASVMMYASCGSASKNSGGYNCDESKATHLKENGSPVFVNLSATSYSSGDIAAMNALYPSGPCVGGDGGEPPIQ